MTTPPATDPREGLECRFRLARGDFVLDIDALLPTRGVTAIFGPSGCGKTTWLRIIAGLERGAVGRVVFRGERWQSRDGRFVPPRRRAIGFVFQDAALFPHLSVRDNLLYGARRAPAGDGSGSAAADRMSFDEVVERLRLSTLLPRYPATLSGGEAQRVAIGRALLAAPRLLLMDEPLSALDEAARHDILDLLEDLRARIAVPVVYVSHNRAEVARLADFAVLMRDGRVRARGSVFSLFARLDVAREAGSEAAAVIEATVAGEEEEWRLTRLTFPGGTFLVAGIDRPTGARVRLRVLARDVSLTLERQRNTSILNIFPATVVEMLENGPAGMLVRLDVAGTPLLSAITRRSASHLALAPGRRVFAQVKAVALIG